MRARQRRTYAELLDRLPAAGRRPRRRRPRGPRRPAEPWEAGQDLALLYMTNGPEYLEGMLGAYLGPGRAGQRQLPLHRRGGRPPAWPTAPPGPPSSTPASPRRSSAGRVRRPRRAGRRRRQRHPLPTARVDYEAALAAADPSDRTRDTPSPDDLYVVYTGGTTGMPKGVLWRQDDFLAGALGVRGTYDGLAAAADRFDPTRLRALPRPRSCTAPPTGTRRAWAGRGASRPSRRRQPPPGARRAVPHTEGAAVGTVLAPQRTPRAASGAT